VEQKKTRKPAAATGPVSLTLEKLRDMLDVWIKTVRGRDAFLLKYVKFNEKSGMATIRREVFDAIQNGSAASGAADTKDAKETAKKPKTGRFVCFRQTDALRDTFKESEKALPGQAKEVETAEGKYFSLSKNVLNAWNDTQSFTKSDWDNAKSFGKDKEPLELPRWFKEMTRNE
jgi:hypothetical protein